MLKHFNFMMTSSLVLPVLTFGLDLHGFQNLKLYTLGMTWKVFIIIYCKDQVQVITSV